MIKVTPQMSISFRIMSLAGAFLVALIHVPAALPETGIESDVFYFLHDCIARCAVPFFFFTSGFFLASHVEEPGWYKRAIQSRFYSLLVPYVSWALIQFVIGTVVLIVINVLNQRSILNDVDLGANNVALILGLNPFKLPRMAPLWFLRSLMLFVLVSPAVVWLNTHRRIMPVFLFGLFSLGAAFSYFINAGLENVVVMFFTFTFSISGLFYFSFGIFLRTYGCVCVLQMLSPWMTIVALALGLGATLLHHCHCSTASVFTTLSVPCLLAGLYRVTEIYPVESRLKVGAHYSFPIYLIHGIVFLIISLLLKRFGRYEFATGNLISVLFLWMTGVGLSFIVSMLFNRIFPRVSEVLFGGRRDDVLDCYSSLQLRALS